MADFDVNDENKLKAHCAKTEEIAEQYKQACADYADVKISLDKLYVTAIKEQKIKESMSYEKSLPIVASNDPESQAEYEMYVKTEMLMKGLSKVLETRQQTIILWQSLLKHRVSQKI